MVINLKKCDPECTECIRSYIKKHSLKKGESFDILCDGIPLEYIPEYVLASLEMNKDEALAMVNPIVWAAKYLDWFCIDPKGKEWKRKTDEGTLHGFEPYDADLAKQGKSIFHRPYQAQMILCQARRKVFRIGRQCLTADTLITTTNGEVKKIVDIAIGEKVLSLDTDSYIIEEDSVSNTWCSGERDIFEIKTKFGHTVKCSADHPFLVVQNKIDQYNGITIDNINKEWISIRDGLKKGNQIAATNLQFISKKYVRISRDVFWDYITSIKPIGKEITYDLTLNKNHNFIANGIITHNSGKSEALIISILFNIFTRENYKVEVLAPYSAQVDLIFKRLTDYITRNSSLHNAVKRNVKAPQYTIELKNGSIVKGFTAGTSSKQDAGQSRGQDANMLIFDEADQLSINDIEAALAVIINHPNATVWMSSTPTGKREKFYDTCFSKEYKEFHFPSQVNPNWNEKLERYFKGQYTEEGYNHEILALFGEQEEGVYKKRFVEIAQCDYEYGDYHPNPLWVFTIGVDWNDVKIGTTIAVLGYNPLDSKFYLVDKVIVNNTERTQLIACEKIAELNRKWNAAWIYVDAGYGMVQIELLHDYGAKNLITHGPAHPDTKLKDIVKAFDFGSSIEVRDLFTKQPILKPAKPFLVENSVRRFENKQICYPKSDTHFTKQLEGYIVDHVSHTGRPVYKAQNEKVGDHLLDAVNLALVAYTLEKTQLGKPVFLSSIAIAGKFGEGETASTSSENKYREQPQLPQSRIDALTDNRLIKPVHGDMPLNANTGIARLNLWSWPGFLRDEPPPTRKNSALSPRKGQRPYRKNFHRG